MRQEYALSSKIKKLLFLFFLSFPAFVLSSQKILVTTSTLREALKVLLKDKVQVELLIPPSLCPGHSDIKFKDAQFIEEADFIFCHGWEPILKKITKLNKKAKVFKVDAGGSPMLPSNFLRMTEKIRNILSEYFRDKEFIDKNFLDFKNKLKKIEKRFTELRMRILRKNIKVIASVYQRNFLEGLGFKIVACFKRKETTSLKELKDILDKARKENVKIVFSNLQSEDGLGRYIAEMARAKFFVLTNFPLNGYLHSLKENLRKIERSLE